MLTVALLDVLEIEHVAELARRRQKCQSNRPRRCTNNGQTREDEPGCASYQTPAVSSILYGARPSCRIVCASLMNTYTLDILIQSADVEIRPLLYSKHDAQLDPFHSLIPNCSPSQFIQSEPLCQVMCSWYTNSKRRGSRTPVQVAQFTEHKVPIIVPKTGTSPGTFSIV